MRRSGRRPGRWGRSRGRPATVGSAAEVFRVFLGLGLTSFGGPVAHLGYFRDAFVVRRRWLDDNTYADLVALCQFLPGPASSQVGMAIGLHRGGYRGMLAAWSAFTLPSAVLMVAFAYGYGLLGDVAGSGWIAGLKIAAVAVVANAVLGMARSLAPDAERATVAVAAMAVVLLVPSVVGQVVAIIAGGLLGLVWLRPRPPDEKVEQSGSETADGEPTASDSADSEPNGPEPLGASVRPRVAVACLAVFAGLLVLLPVLAALTSNGVARSADAFYRAGSLVFGGGHVVLPLLQHELVGAGMVDQDAFLAGYGAAQAVPGPLFTFAGYAGAAANEPPNGLLGAAIALVAVFLPSALLVVGVLPFWERVRSARRMRSALAGVNAAVVGLLAAALWNPVFVSSTIAVDEPITMVLAVAGFLALARWRLPAWAVVLASALAGALLL